MARTGRPKGSGLKLTPKTIEEFKAGMALGLTRTGMAYKIGVAPSTVTAWYAKGTELLEERRRGRELDPGDKIFADFAEATQTGEADAEHFVTSKLHELIAEKHPGAIFFWLERRRPEQYMRRERQIIEASSANKIAEEILAGIVPALEEVIPDPVLRRRVLERIASASSPGRAPSSSNGRAPEAD